MISESWPLFNLSITTPRLEMRLPSDDEIAATAAAVKSGPIHGETIPFVNDWSSVPEPEFGRQFCQFRWKERASWTPDA